MRNVFLWWQILYREKCKNSSSLSWRFQINVSINRDKIFWHIQQKAGIYKMWKYSYQYSAVSETVACFLCPQNIFKHNLPFTTADFSYPSKRDCFSADGSFKRWNIPLLFMTARTVLLWSRLLAEVPVLTDLRTILWEEGSDSSDTYFCDYKIVTRWARPCVVARYRKLYSVFIFVSFNSSLWFLM